MNTTTIQQSNDNDTAAHYDKRRREFLHSALRTTFVASVFAATCGNQTLLGNILPDGFREDDHMDDDTIIGDGKQRATVTGIYTMKFSDFPVLRNTNGSVRLQIPGAPLSLGQIVVTRYAQSSFSALSEACTHSGCAIENFANGRFNCFCHGSIFDGQGRVVRGPAASPLPSYPTTYKANDDFVQIDIPGLVISSSKDDVQSLAASLEQNFPNPASNITSIEYTIARPTYVSIALLSLLGKEVLEIVRKDHEAGQYRASVDVSQLSRGVYLYRMDTSGGFSQTRKLTVV
jgi:nitrite reductase/ring-hydroxylating ferredoxin subunit